MNKDIEKFIIDYGQVKKFFKKKNGVFSSSELICKALPNIIIPSKEDRE